MYKYTCCINFKPGTRKIGLEQGEPVQWLGLAKQEQGSHRPV